MFLDPAEREKMQFSVNPEVKTHMQAMQRRKNKVTTIHNIYQFDSIMIVRRDEQPTKQSHKSQTVS